MNYLQYIASMNYGNQPFSDIRFLLSGTDSAVRQVLGHHILTSAFNRHKTLFLVDNTQNHSELTNLGPYRVTNILNGDINLCEDLLEVFSLKGISRLRSLLMDLGFDSSRTMKVVRYLSFVRETENRLGNSGVLTADILMEYGGSTLVKWKLRQLVEAGKLSDDSYDYLLCRFAEVSSAAADFEMFLVLLEPFLHGTSQPTEGIAIRLPIGEFESDKPVQKMMSKLMMSFVNNNPDSCAILILDAGKGDRSEILDILMTLPITTNAYLLSNDAFSMDEENISILMNTFPVRIYSRHETMSSCSKIESCCGYVDVVKRSYTTTIDKRLRANSAFDMLLGTNRTEAEMRNAPVREARYRREIINALRSGTAIIDCGGVQVLFQF